MYDFCCMWLRFIWNSYMNEKRMIHAQNVIAYSSACIHNKNNNNQCFQQYICCNTFFTPNSTHTCQWIHFLLRSLGIIRIFLMSKQQFWMRFHQRIFMEHSTRAFEFSNFTHLLLIRRKSKLRPPQNAIIHFNRIHFDHVESTLASSLLHLYWHSD